MNEKAAVVIIVFTVSLCGCYTSKDHLLGTDDIQDAGACDACSDSEVERDGGEETNPEPPPSGCDGPIAFSDENLEQLIRIRIDQPQGDIFYDDVKDITLIHFGEVPPEVNDLTGMQCLTSLTHLNFFGGNIDDLSPVANLTNITWIQLGELNLTDISALSGLVHTKFINLYGNNITDITPLSGMTELRYLELGGNRISDISPLSGLANLTGLLLSGNHIERPALSDLPNLDALDLGRNQITTMADMSQLPMLAYLILSDNALIDLEEIDRFPSLVHLELDRNYLRDIGGLSTLTNLAYLSLTDNELTEISELVANEGIGKGDRVDISSNSLDCFHIETVASISALESRGVALVDDCNPIVVGQDAGD